MKRTGLITVAILFALAASCSAEKESRGRLNLLLESAKGCDRLRVRSGGTCHRDREKEKILIEVKGRGRVAAFLKPGGVETRH